MRPECASIEGPVDASSHSQGRSSSALTAYISVAEEHVQDGMHRGSSAPRACSHQVYRGGDHARRKCRQPNGIDLSTRKMSNDQGNLCSMLKQTTAMPIVSQGYNITGS